MFLPALIIAVLIICLYWALRLRSAPAGTRRSMSIFVLLLVFATAGVLACLDSLNRSNYGENQTPILIVMATDLSLSMGAVPDPHSRGKVPTRLKRAKKVVLSILNGIDAAGASMMMGITGFTAKSETILAWDDNISQLDEVINYVLTPGLLTEPGSDLGEALAGAVPLFDNLPQEYRKRDTKKYLILVSDGEETVKKGDISKALGELRTRGVNIIALQAGLFDTPEGLPVYDELGRFQGFDEIAGQIYTVPDAKTMKLVSGNDAGKGLYVRAEDPGAAKKMSRFMGVKVAADLSSSPLYVALVLLLLVLSIAMLLAFE